LWMDIGVIIMSKQQLKYDRLWVEPFFKKKKFNSIIASRRLGKTRFITKRAISSEKNVIIIVPSDFSRKYILNEIHEELKKSGIKIDQKHQSDNLIILDDKTIHIGQVNSLRANSARGLSFNDADVLFEEPGFYSADFGRIVKELCLEDKIASITSVSTHKIDEFTDVTGFHYFAKSHRSEERRVGTECIQGW